MNRVFANLGRGALFFIGVVVTAVVTALITGQPVSGLAKVQGLYRTFILSSVSAWQFSTLLVIALLEATILFLIAQKSPRKGRVHFVPDLYNTYWNKRTECEIQASVSGTFTYEGPEGGTVILRGWLKGTSPLDFDVMLTDPGTGRTIDSRDLFLHTGVPQRAVLYLRLECITGNLNSTLNTNLVLADKFNRRFCLKQVVLERRGK